MRFGLTSICREDAVSDFDLYESEIEELYQKPEEPKVELTVEEAKKVVFDLKFLKSFAPFVPNEVIGRIVQIEKLIEQVEKGNETK